MFVNYTHPGQLRETGKRRQVSSFAARPRHNAALLKTRHRRGTFSWTRDAATCCLSRESSETSSEVESEAQDVFSDHNGDVSQEIVRDSIDDLLGYAPSGGLRVDPFGAYPVQVSRDALKAIDICAI